MAIFIAWIFGSIIAAFMGSGKKIGSTGAFFLALFLSPIVGIIAAVASREDSEIKLQESILSNQNEILKETNKYANISIADEIIKFKQLYESGAITEEEYEIQKKRLLSDSIVSKH